MKKGSRTFNDTISNVRSLGLDKNVSLPEGINISHYVGKAHRPGNARLPAIIHYCALEDGNQNVASFLEAVLVPERHSEYAFLSRDKVLLIRDLTRMHET